MNILAIETSSDICSIALIVNSKCEYIVEKSIPRQHAEKLPIFFNELMKATEFKLKDADAIAISIGPGSFTGLRIGLSYAKGLAYSYNLPLIPVPTLASLFFGSGTKSDNSIVIISSHRDFYYYQRFSSIVELESAVKIESSELHGINDINDISDTNIIQYGSEKLFQNKNIEFLTVVPSAKWVGELAYIFKDKWIDYEPFKLVPQYISSFKTN